MNFLLANSAAGTACAELDDVVGQGPGGHVHDDVASCSTRDLNEVSVDIDGLFNIIIHTT